MLPGALEALVAFMDAHPEVGIAGPKLLYPDGELQHSCRRFSTPAHLLVRGLHLDRVMVRSHILRDAVYADWDHTTPRDVDYVTGAAMIVRRAAMAQVGLLDEGFRLYFEDQDWCYRMWQGAWRVAYVPDSRMIHNHQHASARGHFSKATRTHIKSMVRFFRKHYLPWPLGRRPVAANQTGNPRGMIRAKVQNLQAFRGVAVLLVVFVHILATDNKVAPQDRWLPDILQLGVTGLIFSS